MDDLLSRYFIGAIAIAAWEGGKLLVRQLVRLSGWRGRVAHLGLAAPDITGQEAATLSPGIDADAPPVFTASGCHGGGGQMWHRHIVEPRLGSLGYLWGHVHLRGTHVIHMGAPHLSTSDPKENPHA